MSEKFNIEHYFQTMLSISEIDIQDEWKPVIKAHLVTAQKMASIVNNAPIDKDSLELSNCFTPGK